MTDKQIIEVFKNGFYCIEPCPEIKELQAELKRKEQECERLKEYFETAKEASNCNLKALGEMTEWADKLDEENDRLKAENEQLKNNDVFSIRYFKDKCDVLKQTLVEIKEIAEGVKGYDPLAKQILQKISEVEDV